MKWKMREMKTDDKVLHYLKLVLSRFQPSLYWILYNRDAYAGLWDRVNSEQIRWQAEPDTG